MLMRLSKTAIPLGVKTGEACYTHTSSREVDSHFLPGTETGQENKFVKNRSAITGNNQIGAIKVTVITKFVFGGLSLKYRPPVF
jgi:hypothetical protein